MFSQIQDLSKATVSLFNLVPIQVSGVIENNMETVGTGVGANVWGDL